MREDVGENEGDNMETYLGNVRDFVKWSRFMSRREIAICTAVYMQIS